MWGGKYVIESRAFNYFLQRQSDIYGLSTYLSAERLGNYLDEPSERELEGIQFIRENEGSWNRINAQQEAICFFDWERTRSVIYSDYLVNHTQRLAVDLADYFSRSKMLSINGIVHVIDAVPFLTETGGGTPMALVGVSIDSTEKLATSWCGDLLEIVDAIPAGYSLIDCCLADVKGRARHCYKHFGVNEDGYLLGDENGALFEAAGHFITLDRTGILHFKVTETENGLQFCSKIVRRLGSIVDEIRFSGSNI